MTRERKIEEAIRSSGELRADLAFRARLKSEFIDGTIAEGALPRPRRLPRWWWVALPAAAAATVVLFVVMFLPRESPGWTVQAVHGSGQIEVDGRTLAAEDLSNADGPSGTGGRFRLTEQVSLDLRLDDVLLLELDAGSDVTLPTPPKRDARFPLVTELHDGELRLKTGPGFAGRELHIVTTEGRTEIVGTVASVYKYEDYTCVCVLEGTARAGAHGADLEEVPSGMLMLLFEDGTNLVMDISSDHEDDLIDFVAREGDVFSTPE